MADVQCSGFEESLLECESNDHGILQCSDYEVAGLNCEGMTSNTIKLSYFILKFCH